jgi:SAM-dependent methyltransferase
MEIKRKAIRLHWFLSEQLGIDPLRMLKSLRGIPEFLRDLRAFRKGYSGPMVLNPCFGDRYTESGTTRSEYFWQDLIVARSIFEAQPQKHVDVGSRIDGFVAHVASFREIEVFDIRPISATIPGVVFRQANLMSEESITAYTEDLKGYCDSISCLHAIEHFGLGRYGDPIDPQGYLRGISNLSRLLKPGGRCYLSTPIGRQRVEFNANWVFNPATIINAAAKHGLVLVELSALDQQGGRQTLDHPDAAALAPLQESTYHLGIFTFSKLAS